MMQMALFRRCPVPVRQRCVGSRTGYVDEEDEFRLVGAQSCVCLTSLDMAVRVASASSVPGNRVSGLVCLGCVDGVVTMLHRY